MREAIKLFLLMTEFSKQRGMREKSVRSLGKVHMRNRESLCCAIIAGFFTVICGFSLPSKAEPITYYYTGNQFDNALITCGDDSFGTLIECLHGSVTASVTFNDPNNLNNFSFALSAAGQTLTGNRDNNVGCAGFLSFVNSNLPSSWCLALETSSAPTTNLSETDFGIGTFNYNTANGGPVVKDVAIQYFGAKESGVSFELQGSSETPGVWSTTAPSCSQILAGAVSTPLIYGGLSGSQNINATFAPNYGMTLDQAASICDVAGFDWQQTLIVSPQVPSTPMFPHPSNPPQVPPLYFDSNQVPDYPLYYGPNNTCAVGIYIGNVRVGCKTPIVTGNTLNYHDAPGDPCLFGSNGNDPDLAKNNGCGSPGIGGSLEFFTELVGRDSNYLPVFLPVSDSFLWETDYNGTSGGGAKLLGQFNGATDAEADGNGNGGITVLSLDSTPSTSVPEPPTLALFGVGLAGLAWSRSRRLRRKWLQ